MIVATGKDEERGPCVIPNVHGRRAVPGKARESTLEEDASSLRRDIGLVRRAGLVLGQVVDVGVAEVRVRPADDLAPATPGERTDASERNAEGSKVLICPWS